MAQYYLRNVCELNYVTNSQAIFMKLCRIMNFCNGKNRPNFGIPPIQNGQMAAIFDFFPNDNAVYRIR